MSEEPGKPDLLGALRRQRKALSRRDFDEFIALYTPDATVDGSSLGGDVYVLQGRDAIRVFYEEWIDPYEEIDHEGEEFRDLGNGVTFGVVFQRARPAGSSGTVDIRIASVVTWADALIERVTFLTDIDEARAAAEQLAAERG